MSNILSELISRENINSFREYIYHLERFKKKYLLNNEIVIHFYDFCRIKKKSKRYITSSLMRKFLNNVIVLFIGQEFTVILFRYSMAKYRMFKMSKSVDFAEEITVSEYLDLKDLFVMKDTTHEDVMRIDFMPFYDYSPSIRDSKKIGNGMHFLNHNMSSKLFQDPDKWNLKLFDFLKIHKLNKKPLLINSKYFEDFNQFFESLKKTTEWLKSKKPDAKYTTVKDRMKKAGFEAGWGDTVERIVDTMQVLIDLVNEPASVLLRKFISRIPMVSKIAIISPHGWFAQKDVLGRPDTGGQVIYILDQVKALEEHVIKRFANAGVYTKPKILVITRLIPNSSGTTCNRKKEKIYNTKNSWILRVPFKDKRGNIVQDWVSRFKLWPYLDRFANDSKSAIMEEFNDKPDLMIGNYSDGNLVATLLSDRMNVIQCTIAHALEKNKYLFSDLHWRDFEQDYNFSLQFTADIISMNKSNFIITSTNDEIAGTEDSIGQYEMYQFFTLPGLFQVKSGVNLFHPKFNVIPPGVNEDIYFPYYHYKKRVLRHTKHWLDRLFYNNKNDIVGYLKDDSKIPIFALSRLDKVKNIPGLIEAFGLSKKLREECNLIIAGGTTDIKISEDEEEKDQIKRIYTLIKKYKLEGSMRWLPSIDKADTGEVYRIIADHKGIYVQSALFEAFGLTIVEAMLSGLPTFGTQFGGPSEIIVNRESGFLINTSKPDFIGEKIEEFLSKNREDSNYWKSISENGINRIRKHFTWNLYSERLITLTNLYSFWRHSVSGEGKIKMSRYCDLMYHLLFKKRAEALEKKNITAKCINP